jgi:hypothetical protein
MKLTAWPPLQVYDLIVSEKLRRTMYLIRLPEELRIILPTHHLILGDQKLKIAEEER